MAANYEDDSKTTTTKIEPNIPSLSLLSAGGDHYKLRCTAADLCCVDPTQIEDAFPCTPFQQGLLALTARQAGYYVARYVVELLTPLDLFRSTWNRVVETTPILRTRVIDLSDEEGLTQVVINEPVVWITGCHLDEYIEADKRQDMRLGEKLSRYCLIDDGRRRFFVWTIHHALYDSHTIPALMLRATQAHRGDTFTAPLPFQHFIKATLDIDETHANSLWQQHFEQLEAEPFP
jgi:hypothetical protein